LYRKAKTAENLYNRKEKIMQITNNLSMVSVLVSDMKKAKEFYAEKLGLEVATDYRQNDNNWWVTLTFPGGGASITLARSSTTHNEPPKPGTLSFYFSTSDITAAHQALSENGVEIGEIMDDLYGPGSGVKFFQLKDPDGNQVTFAQA
jgi:predicted enzyme related to lactoylglutathione lyase